MFIYMFKLYQQTQSICFTSYINAIILISSIYSMYIVSFSLFYAVIMLFWMLNIPAEKQKLSWLYGQLLLVPFNILKSNNRIVMFLKEAVEYTDVWYSFYYIFGIIAAFGLVISAIILVRC